MRGRYYFVTLLTGFIACLSLSVTAAEGDDAEGKKKKDRRSSSIEEVVVTGSHIRRDNFDLPSPIDSIGELDIQMSGTTDIGDVIFDQTYQIGVNANTNTSEIGGADDQGTGEGWNQSVNRPDGPSGGETYANLRGVGTRATMTLMDGHRVPTNVSGYGANTRRTGADLGNMYPNIAIARIDNILDGASAIYGAEAVSGVVNMIPRKNFEGLMVNFETQQALENGAPYRKLGLLAGAQGERTSLIFAVEISDADSMAQTDRPDYVVNSAGWTGQNLPTYGERGNGLPGDWRVPLRNATGALADAANDDPALAGTNPFWYSANAQHSTALGRDIHEVYNNINLNNAAGQPSRLDKTGALIPSGADALSSSWAFPQYPRDFDDSTNTFRTLHLEDPGCNNDFGAGHNSLGTAPNLNTFNPGDGDPNRPEPYTTATLQYNDTVHVGNFLNGFRTGNWRGQETRSRGTESNQAFGSDCRYTITDLSDIREERDQEQAMAYFEHELNDYVTLRGEAVFSRLDYTTRTFAPSIDEWPTGVRSYNHTQPIAIGSNPGNPYRAFADGTNSCDIPQIAAAIASCADYVPGHVRDLNDEEAARAFGYEFGGPILVSLGTLDYHDANGDGNYNYLREPGEFLIYAQDSNGDGLPDRDLNGDGIADASELGNRTGQLDPMHRVLLASLTQDADGDGVPDRFDPDVEGNGGIRLFEDVLMGDSGVGIHGYIGAFPKQPYVHESYPWLNRDMSLDDRRLQENMRLRLGTTVNIPETDWYVDFDWIWNKSRREAVSLDPAWPLTVDSLRCQGGPNGDLCWNPFSTAWLSQDADTGLVLPASLQRWREKSDDAWNSSIETRAAGLSPRVLQRDSGMTMVDLNVSNGSLFNLWNDTPVGIALGLHLREETEEFRPDQLGAAGIGSDRTNFQGSTEEVTASFVEVRLEPLDHPFWGQMEIQLAARYTEYDIKASFASAGQTAKFDVTIPKVAIRYQPTEFLAIRGSVTEGFVPPGSYQLFNSAPGDVSFGTEGDYICDLMPELGMCVGALNGGGIPNVRVAQNSGNRGLNAETSDLWNAGFSLSLLGGDLVLEADYTDVEFNGRVERMGAGVILGQNSGPFETYALAQCPGTLIDYDNPDEDPITVETYVAQTSVGELQCRETAAATYILEREQRLGGATIERDPVSNRLTGVLEGWLNQGESKVQSVVYNARYSFDASQIPLLNLDNEWGTFQARLSATQMLEMSLMRYAPSSGHQFAGLRVDGLGNRNSAAFWRPYNALFSPLPPTPEWKVNGTLRWFKGNHMAQLGFRWHDSITDVIASWDEIVERYGPPHSDGNPYLSHDHGMDTTSWTERDACTDQDRNPYCEVADRAYWDLSYTYRAPDLLGFGYVAANVAVRNFTNEKPRAIPSGVGYESYLDSIMGRQLFVRLTAGF